MSQERLDLRLSEIFKLIGLKDFQLFEYLLIIKLLYEGTWKPIFGHN